MKKIKLFCVLLSAVMLASCSGNTVGQEISETGSESTVTTSETTTAETTAKRVTEAKTEEVPQAAEKEYVKVSYGNQFIDFEFIEDYQGTTDIGDLADKAVEFLKESEYYAESMENISEFTDEEFSEYIKDGSIVPKFNIAYPNDYDGYGDKETFIIVDMPYRHGTVNVIRNFLIFANSNEEMEVISSFSNLQPVQLINYGRIKHIAVHGSGTVGIDDHTVLLGVKNKKAVTYLNERCYLAKEDCFLTAFGWMNNGGFMYFDTGEMEYRIIDGVDVSVEDMRAMDTTNVLAALLDYDEELLNIKFIGRTYYCIAQGYTDWGNVYTYNGEVFTHIENSNVVISSDSYDLKRVLHLSIKQALVNMKPPSELYTAETYVEEPYDKYVQVSPDNRFIDYNFIANYPGTKDIGELADKAVEFLKTTKEYADNMKKVDTFTEKGLRRIYSKYDYDEEELEKRVKASVERYSKYLDENGDILPKFKIAYPNDYDSDGKEEAFIVADMPVYDGGDGLVESFLIFSGSDGEMQLLDNFSNAYPTVLLDYGVCKHIAIGGSGIVGAADHTILYGVRSGISEKLYSGRCSFYKEDCFLAAYGWQGSGGYMYYDTTLQEYVAVGSVYIPMNDVKKMDKYNDLADYWFEDGRAVYFDLIGGKYYCARLGPMDTGEIYTYENGRFVLRNDIYARCSEGYSGSTSVDLDIDKAVSQMKPVAEPFSPITKGSTPIDFKYIENYQSASDLDQYKELISEFVNEAYAYSSSKYCTDEMTDEKFAGYTDSDGNLIPKILAAYPNDYNGDGREETFAVFEIPYKVYDDDGGKLVLKSFVVLIDHNGKINQRDYFRSRPANTDGKAVILDYGEKKHILFISKENTVYLYGVHGSRAEEYFSGENCTLKKNGCSLDISYIGDGGCVLYYDNLADDYLTLSGRNFSNGSSMPNPIKAPNG